MADQRVLLSMECSTSGACWQSARQLVLGRPMHQTRIQRLRRLRTDAAVDDAVGGSGSGSSSGGGRGTELFSAGFWDKIDGGGPKAARPKAARPVVEQDEEMEVVYIAPEEEEEEQQQQDGQQSYGTGSFFYEEFGDANDSERRQELVGQGGSRKRLPAEMRCFDTARILVKGGDGGKGCVAFRREKFVPKGGPAGGDGGRGGSVWVVADDALNSLQGFRRQVHYRAPNGQPGSGSNMLGRCADDLSIRVPPGTIVRKRGAEEGEAPLAELIEPGQRALLATGGRGGRGNASFKTGRNNAPALAENGEAGEELWVDLELKLVADVGIVGVPNAGKSTLLSVVSSARPKIANYPFTTLVPNLGVCELDFRTTVFADVPGILEGAHLGIGLGHEFLRHCQRCRLLVHVVDGSSRDPLGDYRAITTELLLFNPDLANKRQVVAYNKMDLPDSSDYFDDVKEWLEQQGGVPGEDIFAVSAATGQGVVDLVRRVRQVLDEMPAEPLTLTTGAVNATEVKDTKKAARLDQFSIEAERGAGQDEPSVFYVSGSALERFVQMTNWDYYEALKRFQAIMDAAGVNNALRRAGVKPGDTVVISDMELEWSDDHSEAALFDAWQQQQKASGRPGMGAARWPHKTKTAGSY